MPRTTYPCRGALALAALFVSLGGVACNSKPLEERARVDTRDAPGGLTPDLAAKVLARVGDRAITLGDYAAALERMSELDRLRYQSPERRRELLNEMIDFELLAAEAQRRGLDRTPETEEAIRQVLRDVVLAEARKGLPAPADLPLPEVRAYYDAHRDEFREPERRRVSAIAFRSAKEAEQALPDAKKASPLEWGKLVQKFADPPGPKPSATNPIESFGDLGIVGPPSDPRGDHPRVPAALRAAIFTVEGEVGAVLDRVVESDGRFFVIKLAGKTGAHERSFQEAERGIRATLLQRKVEEREKALQDELRQQFPVNVDESALAKVQVAPAPAASNAAPPAPAPPGSTPR